MRSAMAKAEKIGWKNNRVWQVKLAKWPPPTLIPEIHEPVSLCWMKRLKHPTGPRHGISRPSYTSCEGKRLSRRPAPFSVKRLLRPAATLARLLRDQGRAAEAHEELAQVYSLVHRRFGTTRLKSSRAYLMSCRGISIAFAINRQVRQGLHKVLRATTLARKSKILRRRLGWRHRIDIFATWAGCAL